MYLSPDIGHVLENINFSYIAQNHSTDNNLIQFVYRCQMSYLDEYSIVSFSKKATITRKRLFKKKRTAFLKSVLYNHILNTHLLHQLES